MRHHARTKARIGAAALAAACVAALATVRPAPGQTAAPDSAVVGAAVDSAAVRRLDPEIIDFTEARVDLWRTGVSPTAAVLMTPVFPGWGQLYAENSWRGALAYGVQMFYWTNILSRDRQARRSRDFAQTFPLDDPNRARYDALATEQWEQMRDFAWWSGGVLLIVALDAYVGAHLFAFDEDPVPVPDRWEDEFGPPGGDMPGGTPAPSLTVFQWRMTF